MEKMNRRELCIALSAFTAFGGMTAFAQSANAIAATSEPQAGNKESGSKELTLSHSQTFPYDDLTVTQLPNGGTMRRVISGVLPTGEFIEIHESMLPAGKMPHPPHRHRNSEILFIREGQLEFLNDGKPEPVGPGGVVFTASNVLHGLKNVGSIPANYFVLAISRAQAES
jgi:mannose-6-phosphate isomerase-like protein (cupin superfamily)